jgi:hypothetical protein
MGGEELPEDLLADLESDESGDEQPPAAAAAAEPGVKLEPGAAAEACVQGVAGFDVLGCVGLGGGCCDASLAG